jgi:hypothetical protein
MSSSALLGRLGNLSPVTVDLLLVLEPGVTLHVGARPPLQHERRAISIEQCVGRL